MIPKEVAKNAEMVKSLEDPNFALRENIDQFTPQKWRDQAWSVREFRTQPDPEDLKDSAEGLLIFFKREDVFIYNGNTIEYHVCGPRWKLHLENRLKQDLITLEYILDYLMLIQYTDSI